MPLGALLAAAVLVAMTLAVALLLRAQRRSRRQIADLMVRLEGLEERWRLAGYPRGGETGLTDTAPRPPDAVAGSADTPPSGDVLAGFTSHVRRLVQAPGGEAESLADQTILCIYRHLEENVAPAQIAEELFVSLRTLERGLAVALDCTPRQLIGAIKMREARRLLHGGGHRVGEVAYRLGFSDPFHFSRRFKAFYGVAPSQIRPTGARAQTGGVKQ